LHIGSEQSVSILELAQAVARVSTTELNFVPEITVAVPTANSEKYHQYIPNNSATKSQLNVQEWTSLETGITLMIRDCLS
jgi:nucleoside-diphosphate-sugar epimerase